MIEYLLVGEVVLLPSCAKLGIICRCILIRWLGLDAGRSRTSNKANDSLRIPHGESNALLEVPFKEQRHDGIPGRSRSRRVRCNQEGRRSRRAVGEAA